VCTENLNPHVMVMKSAKYGVGFDASGPLNWARDRPARNCRPVWHPGIGTDGAEAFATGEAVANRVSDLGAVIGRPAALGLVLGLHGGDQ
jgi:hypothetical protein